LPQIFTDFAHENRLDPTTIKSLSNSPM